MTLSDFKDKSQVSIGIQIEINDEIVFTGGSLDIDSAIDLLGKIDRCQLVNQKILEQFNDSIEGEL
jgi:hypothetical protein